MVDQSERLERETRGTRAQLSRTMDELRAWLVPGRTVDELIAYARDGPGAEFSRNLAREVREHPLPLVLIGIGIVWLIAASSRSARQIAPTAADAVTSKGS